MVSSIVDNWAWRCGVFLLVALLPVVLRSMLSWSHRLSLCQCNPCRGVLVDWLLVKSLSLINVERLDKA